MLELALLVGCRREASPPAGGRPGPFDTTEPVDSSADTGAPAGPCFAHGPCSATLAAATWNGPPLTAAGTALEAGRVDDVDVLLVSAPYYGYPYTEAWPQVAALAPEGLTELGQFEDHDNTNLTSGIGL